MSLALQRDCDSPQNGGMCYSCFLEAKIDTQYMFPELFLQGDSESSPYPLWTGSHMVFCVRSETEGAAQAQACGNGPTRAPTGSSHGCGRGPLHGAGW